MASPIQELLDELDRMANRADRAERFAASQVYRESQDILRDYMASDHRTSILAYGLMIFSGLAAEGSGRGDEQRAAFKEVRDTVALVADVHGIDLGENPEPTLF